MKILLADPETNIRYGLKTYFETLPEFSITGEAENLADLFSALKENIPDVILLSLKFIDKNHESFLINIKKLYPSTKILGMDTNPELNHYANLLGVDGFINKADQPENMIRIIKESIII